MNAILAKRDGLRLGLSRGRLALESSIHRHVRSALTVSVALVAVGVTAPAASAAPAPVTSTFNYTGNAQSFTVPAGVHSVTVSATGGTGAGRSRTSQPVPGGSGGTASGTFAVAPGDVLSVLVAEDGGFTTWNAAGYLHSSGGYGFGRGGTSSEGGGGGGASGVVNATGRALVVAGGGGGTGDFSALCLRPAENGGAGGSAGQPGSPGGTCSTNLPGAAGLAGTDTAAGAGGAAQAASCENTPYDGLAGSGHDGGGKPGGYEGGFGWAGGAGGGGWYGGGQGADGCWWTSSGGGGGGSNHVDSGATNPATGTSTRAWGQNGVVTISYVTPSDTTPPVITPSVAGAAPKPTTAWYTDSPVVHFEVSDNESAITSTTGCEDTTISSDALGQTVTCQATSDGGAASSTVTINRDATAPTVAFDTGGVSANGSYLWGTTLAVPTCSATDATSGVNSNECVVTGYSTAVGPHTLTATATDNAGNLATLTQAYTVTPWTTTGFSRPVDMGGVINTVKGGSTVPLKFSVKAGFSPVTDPATVGSFSASQVGCTTGAPSDAVETTTTGSTSLRYDATAGQFVYNWKTPKAAGDCYKLTLTTADGSTTNALFQLK